MSICVIMDKSSKIISENVSEIRDAIGLSQGDFVLLTGISRATLVNIESGKKSINLKSLEGITTFTKIELDKLTKKGFKPPENLREKLLKYYKREPDINVILGKEPSIPYCIKYKLLNTDFLNKPKETREIRKFFKDNYGWEFKGNSIHSSLRRLKHIVKIEPHPTKKGTNLYSRKR